MDIERLYRLLELYTLNKISRQDCEELLDYLDKAEDSEEVSTAIDEFFKGKQDEFVLNKFRSELVLKRIKTDARFSASRTKPISIFKLQSRLQWPLIAATLLLVGAVSFWFFSATFNDVLKNTNSSSYNKKTESNLAQKDLLPSKTSYSINKTVVHKDIMPGGSRAVLTLSSGKVFSLNGIDTGLIAYAGGTRISNEKNGLLLFKETSTPSAAVLSYSTITTSKAGEYKVLLPDGTRVWLNSSSSIRFPSAFVGKLRKVQLTGEAYFEVAKNKEKPFHVEASGVVIKVLGTHFNVSSYKQGVVKTSLIEGAVIVEAHNLQAKKLKPGQQATVVQNKYIKVSDADVEDAIAWKDGFFKFQDEDIKSIMENIARWYDVEVTFEDNTAMQRFGGVFSKSKSLSELLSSFEEVGNIHFKTEGRRITVTK